MSYSIGFPLAWRLIFELLPAWISNTYAPLNFLVHDLLDLVRGFEHLWETLANILDLLPIVNVLCLLGLGLGQAVYVKRKRVRTLDDSVK
jgi:hypothetical protein